MTTWRMGAGAFFYPFFFTTVFTAEDVTYKWVDVHCNHGSPGYVVSSIDKSKGTGDTSYDRLQMFATLLQTLSTDSLT